jgi:hypothetical protein
MISSATSAGISAIPMCSHIRALRDPKVDTPAIKEGHPEAFSGNSKVAHCSREMHRIVLRPTSIVGPRRR